MDAAAGKVIRMEELAGMETIGVKGAAGALNVTPVVVHSGWEASAVAVPFAVKLYTCTAKAFGLLARTMTSAVLPGTRVVAGLSPATRASTVTVCMVPFAAEPLPIPIVDQ